MMSMDNTPGFSGEIPDGYTTGVETIGRCLPRKPGKFCTLIYKQGSSLPSYYNAACSASAAA
ncbi:Uncharacterised protein [Iodobacter fluviatilis]|uniref:Uncharacterized protein n=1 Tax=Iodobacter fluviatilis TaxID=537 RepID=A0A377Q635_9NEIS|nr:Uncharacterised protein [Iodobacter fluviatilis]